MTVFAETNCTVHSFYNWSNLGFVLNLLKKYVSFCNLLHDKRYHLVQATLCQNIARFVQLNQNGADDFSMVYVLLTSNWSGYQIKCVEHICFNWFLSYSCFFIEVFWQHFGLQNVNCSEIQDAKVSEQFRRKTLSKLVNIF